MDDNFENYKILVVTDGFPDADMVLMYAIGLAKDLGSKMDVIHVQTRDETGEEASNVLKAAIQPVKNSLIKDVNEILSQGDHGDVIVKTANDLKPDVIVMSRRGLSQITSLVSGSISYRVVQNSTRPVLIEKKRDGDSVADVNFTNSINSKFLD